MILKKLEQMGKVVLRPGGMLGRQVTLVPVTSKLVSVAGKVGRQDNEELFLQSKVCKVLGNMGRLANWL